MDREPDEIFGRPDGNDQPPPEGLPDDGAENEVDLPQPTPLKEPPDRTEELRRAGEAALGLPWETPASVENRSVQPGGYSEADSEAVGTGAAADVSREVDVERAHEIKDRDQPAGVADSYDEAGSMPQPISSVLAGRQDDLKQAAGNPKPRRSLKGLIPVIGQDLYSKSILGGFIAALLAIALYLASLFFLV